MYSKGWELIHLYLQVLTLHTGRNLSGGGGFIPASMYGPGIIFGLLRDYDEASAIVSLMNVVHKVRQERWCKRDAEQGPNIN